MLILSIWAATVIGSIWTLTSIHAYTDQQASILKDATLLFLSAAAGSIAAHSVMRDEGLFLYLVSSRPMLAWYLLTQENKDLRHAAGEWIRYKKLIVACTLIGLTAGAVIVGLSFPFQAVIAGSAIWSTIDMLIVHYRIVKNRYGNIEVEALEVTRFCLSFPEYARSGSILEAKRRVENVRS